MSYSCVVTWQVYSINSCDFAGTVTFRITHHLIVIWWFKAHAGNKHVDTCADKKAKSTYGRNMC